MLSQLTLTNFQSHKDSVLDLDPGVNVIVGTSDSGKSAILRALRWAVENKPLGDSFRSHWADKEKTSATVIVDGIPVERVKRGTGTNMYICDGEEYKALGQDIPKPVSDLLNVVPEVNFQWQHDPAFLLSKNSGEVARILNRSVQLDVIDSALSAVGGFARAVSSEITQLETERSRIDSGLEKFAGLDALAGRAEAAAGLAVKRTERAKFRDLLARTLQRYTQADSALKIAHSEMAGVELERVEEIAGKLAETRTQRNRLYRLVQTGIRSRSIIEEGQTVAGVDLSPLRDYENHLRELRKKRESLSSGLSKLKNLMRHLTDAKKELAEDTRKFEAMMPETCPLCGK